MKILVMFDLEGTLIDNFKEKRLLPAKIKKVLAWLMTNSHIMTDSNNSVDYGIFSFAITSNDDAEELRAFMDNNAGRFPFTKINYRIIPTIEQMFDIISFRKQEFDIGKFYDTFSKSSAFINFVRNVKDYDVFILFDDMLEEDEDVIFKTKHGERKIHFVKV